MQFMIGYHLFIVPCSYFKVLIQEMDVRVDKGFLMAIIDFFTSEKTRGQEVCRFTCMVWSYANYRGGDGGCHDQT